MLYKMFLHFVIVFHLSLAYLCVSNGGKHLYIYLSFVGFFIYRLYKIDKIT